MSTKKIESNSDIANECEHYYKAKNYNVAIIVIVIIIWNTSIEILITH